MLPAIVVDITAAAKNVHTLNPKRYECLLDIVYELHLQAGITKLSKTRYNKTLVLVKLKSRV